MAEWQSIVGSRHKKSGDKVYKILYENRPGVNVVATVFAPNEAKAKEIFRSQQQKSYISIKEEK